MSRVLAIDPGSKRIGLAISDPTGVVALSLESLERDPGQGWADHIKSLVEEHTTAEVVVGLPKNMDGSEGPAAADARRVCQVLQDRLSVPVKLWDERLTTVAAQRMFREAGVTARRSRKRLDAVAAVLILQGYLDSRAKGQSPRE